MKKKLRYCLAGFFGFFLTSSIAMQESSSKNDRVLEIWHSMISCKSKGERTEQNEFETDQKVIVKVPHKKKYLSDYDFSRIQKFQCPFCDKFCAEAYAFDMPVYNLIAHINDFHKLILSKSNIAPLELVQAFKSTLPRF